MRPSLSLPSPPAGSVTASMKSFNRNSIGVVSVVALLVLTAALLRSGSALSIDWRHEGYTYLGKDYPRTWDIGTAKVHKAMEDTVHYAHDTALGLLEWNSTLPPGGGMLHLGPHNRVFSVSMFHQLRCLDVIGRELLDRSEQAVIAQPTALAHHCMHYLRLMVLCRSDTRLESAYNIMGPRIVTSSITHTCNDWSAVYAAAEDNYLAYIDRRARIE